MNIRSILAITFSALLVCSAVAFAKPAPVSEADIEKATMSFKKDVKDADTILSKAKGYLIFPSVTKAGIGVGGEYGKGALVVDGEVKSYYSTKAASVGLQVGVQEKSMVIIFTTEEALTAFEKSSGWEAGVDGSIAVADMGKSGSIDTTNMTEPIVAYIYGEKGLMADVSLSGSKFTKLEMES